MKATSSEDKIKFAQLSKLFAKARQTDVRNFKVSEIERAAEKSTSIKSVRNKQHLAENKMHALKDKKGNVINNVNEIAKVAGDVETELYSSQTVHALFIEIEAEEDTEILMTKSKTRANACPAGKQLVKMV